MMALIFLVELLIVAATALERHWREESGRCAAQPRPSLSADMGPRQGASVGGLSPPRAARPGQERCP